MDSVMNMKNPWEYHLQEWDTGEMQEQFASFYENDAMEDNVVLKTVSKGPDETVERKDLQVQFTKNTVEIDGLFLTREQIRYVSTGHLTHENNEIVLSYRVIDNDVKQLETKYIYIQAADAAMALRILNKFREFKFMAAMGYTWECVAVLDFLTPKMACRLVVEIKDQQGAKIDETVFTVTLDEECVCFFSGRYQAKPDYQIDLWKDDCAGVVEKMAVLNDNIIIETKTLSYRINKEQPHAMDFVRFAKEIRPKPSHIFTDTMSMLQYIKPKKHVIDDVSNVSRDYSTDVDTTSMSMLQYIKPKKHVTDDVSILSGDYSTDVDTAVDQSAQQYLRDFKESLETAYVEGQKNEDWQSLWQPNEEILCSLLEANLIPEKDPRSGGLDPKNIDHFRRSMEDLDDKLFSQDIDGAIASLRAVRDVFGKDGYASVRPILADDDYTLLKKLYFKILKDQTLG